MGKLIKYIFSTANKSNKSLDKTSWLQFIPTWTSCKNLSSYYKQQNMKENMALFGQNHFIKWERNNKFLVDAEVLSY